MATDEGQTGIVYVLTNPAMPGLVKIGKTSRDSVEARLFELYSTGVPFPFECAYAARVNDEGVVERAFHQAFGPYRVNAKREFFEIEPEQAIALLRLMAVEDVTPMVQGEADNIDAGTKEAGEKLKSRRPNQNFIEMGIPVGSTLVFRPTGATVEVISKNKVEYEGREYSLTALARDLIEPLPKVPQRPFWLFNGRALSEIYNETYGPP